MKAEDLDRMPSLTDWARVDALTDADIKRAIAEDPDAAPTLDAAFWRNAEILDPRNPKSTITIRVDDEVLDFFRQDGPGYQSRMHAVLKAYAHARRDETPVPSGGHALSSRADSRPKRTPRRKRKG